MAEIEKKEVFISYCTKNKELAKLFCNIIEGTGVSCWIAPRDIPSGGAWAVAIANGIENSRILALLVSEASMGSPEVEKEVDMANTKRMTILPIKIENAELKGAFKYHLGNKQWIDALDEDQTQRFSAATEAILQNLGKESTEGSNSGSGCLTLARVLANDLNNKYAKSSQVIKPTFSARDNQGHIEIIFPFRLGVTGVDIRFRLTEKERTMGIFADRAVKDDPLNWAFNAFALGKKDEFPRMIQTSSRRLGITTFEPSFPLAIAGGELTEEKLFSLFRDNVIASSEKIIPDLLAWVEYGQKISNAIAALEARLKTEFKEEDGWRVGSPEGSRMEDLRGGGEINVYKTKWEPDQDNYKGRGLISFTLRSDENYLNKVYIGISKYESWHQLGEWDDSIKKKVNEILEKTETQDSNWVCRQLLDGWDNSGIASRSFPCQEKLNDFVDYCVDNFKKLKGLEKVIDDACKDIPTLQIKNPLEMPSEQQTWNNGLYIYNYLRLISANCNQKAKEAGMTFSFMSRKLDWEWVTLEAYLTFKVGSFDAAATFTCTKRKITVAFKSLEPPDFEEEIIKSFFDKRGIYNRATATISVSTDLDGKSVAEWLDRYASFVYDQLDLIIPEFIALRAHLEGAKDLALFVSSKLEEALGNKVSEWKVENQSITLEKDKPISFWHKSWLKTGAKDDDLPPLMFQIVPCKPCFDDLAISLRQNEPFEPEFEHRLGMVCGACEFAFGKEHDPQHQIGIWSTSFPIFSITEGSSLNNHLLANENKAELGKNVFAIASSVLKMETLVTKLCKDHNFQTHFLTELKTFIDKFTKTLCDLFPEKEGWKMGSDISSLKRPSYLRFYKQIWQGQKSDQKYGIINLTLQSASGNFDNLLYGIMPTESISQEQTKKIHDKMTDLFKNGRSSDGWPWWQYAELPFRKTGGNEQKLIDEETQLEMIEYFRKKFSSMKEEIAPLIDTLLTETNKNVTQIASSEVKPA